MALCVLCGQPPPPPPNPTMSDILIQAEHVSKKFCRSLKRSLWYGMKDVAHSLNPWSRTQQETDLTTPITAQPLRKDEFWALQDINFEVRRGECLGLIGHNGAGKSTLLKMLNGLIRPDHGRITMRGRVAALIELNAGFNNLLTGRENVYSQAALLGFSRSETSKRFDAIVDFSELGAFIDSPVQNYSSGMKVKLGFAIFASLEPDILLIDEVLAVGDLGFRYKCLNRIGKLLPQCAVIFVSHSMTQIMRVSSSIMMLNKGMIHYCGADVVKGMEKYLSLFEHGELATSGSGEILIDAISIQSSSGERCNFGGSIHLTHGGTLHMRAGLQCHYFPTEVVIQVLFWNHEMLPVLDVADKDCHGFRFTVRSEFEEISLELNDIPLNSGKYNVSIILTSPSLDRVYCQKDNSFTLYVKGASPASGAGCIKLGLWTHEKHPFALKTRLLLEQSLADGHRVTPDTDAIFRELGVDDIAVDCGANVGKVTEKMALRGATVFAFEPDPVAFESLSRRMGNFDNVRLLNQAVSSSDGTMKLYFRDQRNDDPLDYSQGSSLHSGKTDISLNHSVDVKVVRLRTFLEQFERIRILKMDIEGAECDVLDDLLESDLLRRIDLVLVETHEEWIPETIPRMQRIRLKLNEQGHNHVFLNWI